MLLTSTFIFLEKPSNVGLRRVDLCSLTSASREVSSFYYICKQSSHIAQNIRVLPRFTLIITNYGMSLKRVFFACLHPLLCFHIYNSVSRFRGSKLLSTPSNVTYLHSSNFNLQFSFYYKIKIFFIKLRILQAILKPLIPLGCNYYAFSFILSIEGQRMASQSWTRGEYTYCSR